MAASRTQEPIFLITIFSVPGQSKIYFSKCSFFSFFSFPLPAVYFHVNGHILLRHMYPRSLWQGGYVPFGGLFLGLLPSNPARIKLKQTKWTSNSVFFLTCVETLSWPTCMVYISCNDTHLQNWMSHETGEFVFPELGKLKKLNKISISHIFTYKYSEQQSNYAYTELNWTHAWSQI